MSNIKPLWQILEPGPKNKFPEVVYVIVEVPKGSKEKYELDQKTGALFLDRDLFGSMVFPGDYGSIPQTLCEDGDPIDALLVVEQPHYPGVVIPARPVALLEMKDEKGKDNKVLCVPENGVDPNLEGTRDLKDVPEYRLAEIKDFFEHYKSLEPKKWVKIGDWQGKKAAQKYILEATKLYKEKYEKNP
jgi:inorganic pyrophosphatase